MPTAAPASAVPASAKTAAVEAAAVKTAAAMPLSRGGRRRHSDRRRHSEDGDRCNHRLPDRNMHGKILPLIGLIAAS
jgi:hypothetical protein